MASYNRVVLVGNLTRDPELRYIPSGTAVTDIGLTVNDRRKTANGEWVDETTFIDITLWGRQAEIASEYLNITKNTSLAVAVGFADLVSFTALSNELDEHEIGDLVERIEAEQVDQLGEDEDIPSAEALANEFQRFLREQPE